jgi:WD40 repeat protein
MDHDKTVHERGMECLLADARRGHRDYINSVAFSHDSTRLPSALSDRTVKIWDTSSGKCLQTLEIGKTLDATGSYIHTEIGTIAINASPASYTTPNVMKAQGPRYQVGTKFRWSVDNLQFGEPLVATLRIPTIMCSRISEDSSGRHIT